MELLAIIIGAMLFEYIRIINKDKKPEEELTELQRLDHSIYVSDIFKADSLRKQQRGVK